MKRRILFLTLMMLLAFGNNAWAFPKQKILKNIHTSLETIFQEKGLDHNNETPIYESEGNFQVLTCKVDKDDFVIYMKDKNFLRLEAQKPRGGRRYTLYVYTVKGRVEIGTSRVNQLLLKLDRLL